jgi:hypothetical protein
MHTYISLTIYDTYGYGYFLEGEKALAFSFSFLFSIYDLSVFR